MNYRSLKRKLGARNEIIVVCITEVIKNLICSTTKDNSGGLARGTSTEYIESLIANLLLLKKLTRAKNLDNNPIG